MPREEAVRTLDLFCGGGGSSWGARNAGAQIVCGVDAWSVATRTYDANFGDGLGRNVTLRERGRFPRVASVGDIDLILASPECRSHTCARGSGEREESSRRTARYVVRFARRLNPRWIVMENVVHIRNWDGFEDLITEMEKLGYYVTRQVLDASTFGVPQKRRRLFVMFDRNERPQAIPIRGDEPRSVGDHVIAWDGPWASRPLYAAGRADATIEKAERAIEALGRRVPFLVVYYGTDGGGGWQRIDVPLRTLTTLDRFGLVTWSGSVPMLRMLQPPEIQRAMGFGDRYRLPYGSRRDRIKLLGNAVCPPVMQAVVQSLARDRLPATTSREDSDRAA